MKTIKLLNLKFGVLTLAGLLVGSPVALRAASTNIFKANTTTLSSATLDWTLATGGAGGAAAPAFGAIGQFDATISAANAAALSLGGNVSLDDLVFNSSMNGPVTIANTGGYTLTLGAVANPGGTYGVTANTNVTFNCNVAVGTNQNWLVASANTLTVNGVLSGAGGIILNNGGTLNINGGGSIGGGGGTYFSSQYGSLNINSALTVNPQYRLNVGWNTTPSYMNISNTLTMSANVEVDVAGGYNGLQANSTGIMNIGGTAGTPGLFNLGTTTGNIKLGLASGTGSGTINLNSFGTLATSRSITLQTVANSAIVNFNGGTLKLTAAQATMIGAGVNVTNNSAGGTIDCQTFAGTVVAPINGTGGLTKLGSGTLTLSGANTYSGATTVSVGKLVTTTASIGAGSYSVANGATLNVKVSALGKTLTNNSLTLGTSAATTLEFDNGALANPTALIVTNNSLTLNGAVTVNVYGSAFSVGTIDLMGYGSKSGSGSFILGSLPPGVGATLNDTGTKLQLLVTTANTSLLWRGNVSSAWDIGNSANATWLGLPSSLSAYYVESAQGGVPVTFDDTATGSTAITLGVAVKPTSVTINNNSANYSLTGAGKISGSIGITKNGTGTFTIGTSNDFSGTTTINAGTLALSGGDNRLPATTVNFGGPATLNLGGVNQTINTLALVSAATGFTNYVTTGALTLGGAVDFNLMATNNNNVDASGLNSLTFNQSGKWFRLTGNSASSGSTVDFKLGANNNITAGQILIGDNQGGGVNTGKLHLGQTNNFNTTAFNVSSYKGIGLVDFQSTFSNPILTLRGLAGGNTPVGLVQVMQANTGANETGVLDGTLGTIDLIATNLCIVRMQAGSPSYVGTLTLGNSANNSVIVTNFILGAREQATTYTAGGLTATMNQSNGLVKAYSLIIGTNNAITGTTVGMTAVYNLAGGILRAQTIQPGADSGFGTVTRTFNWSGGVIQNFDAGTALLLSNINLTATATNAGRIFRVDATLTNTDLSQINQGTAGALPVIKDGPGTLDLQGATDNSWFSLNGSNGVVLLDKQSTTTPSVHAIGNGLTLNGGTVILAANGGTGGDQIYDGNLVTLNSGTFDLNSQTETIGGLAGTGGTITNSSVYTLTVNVASGTNYVSAATINGGNLTFGGPGTQIYIGTDNRSTELTTINNGVLQIGNGGAAGNIAGASITVNSPGALAFNRSGTLNFAGTINSGTGSIAQNGSGTLTLSGSDYHTGGTLVNSGILALPSGASTMGGSVITVASGATFNTTAGSGYYVNYNQILNGSGAVNGGYIVGTGGTNAGNLAVTGNVTLADGSVLNPGAAFSAGTIAVNGNVTFSGGNPQLVYNLAATTTPGGGTNSLLAITGNLDLSALSAGALQLTIHGTPSSGTYVLATFTGSFSGSASAIQVTGSARYTYTPQVVGHQLQLVVAGNAGNLVWLGDGGANTWDANNSGNTDWTNTTSHLLDYFNTGDNALFNDVSANPVVNIAGTILPASLTINAAGNYTFVNGGGAIDGPIALTKTNSGTLDIQNNNTFFGPVNLNGGVITVAAMAANGTAQPLGVGSTLAFNGGTFQYTGGGAGGDVFNRAITVGANGANIDQSGSAYLFITNQVTGSGPLTKSGSGQLIIGDLASGTGNNAYNGITYVTNGQVQIRNTNALGSISSKTVVVEPGNVAAGGGLVGSIAEPFDLSGYGNGNGALQAQDGGTTVTYTGNLNLVADAGFGSVSGVPFTIGGTISGAGRLVKVSGNTVTLLSTNNYLGATTISNGTLQLGNGTINDTLAGDIDIANGTLAVLPATNTTTVLPGAIHGAGQLLINNNGGIVSLTGSNDWTGTVNVNAGALWINNSNALGFGPKTVQLANGTGGQPSLHLNATNGSITLPPDFTMNVSSVNGIVFNEAGSNTVLSTISMTGGGGDSLFVSKNGTLNLGGTIGAAVGNRGLLLGGAGNGIVSGPVVDSLGAAPRGLYVQGSGTWTVTSTNTTVGTVNVSSGRLFINGEWASTAYAQSGGTLGGSGIVQGNVAVLSGGTLSPGPDGIGTFTINNSFTNSGNLFIEVNKSLAQSNDFVVVAGVLTNTAAGTVTVSNLNYLAPLVAGDSFTLFSQAVSNGAALHIVGGGSSVTWTNRLALDGSIAVLSVTPPVTVNTNTFAITTVFTSTSIQLSWPPDRLGWTLQSQTNLLNAGLGTNWLPWSGSSAVTNVTIPINPAKPTVFFRMVYP